NDTSHAVGGRGATVRVGQNDLVCIVPFLGEGVWRGDFETATRIRGDGAFDGVAGVVGVGHPGGRSAGREVAQRIAVAIGERGDRAAKRHAFGWLHVRV